MQNSHEFTQDYLSTSARMRQFEQEALDDQQRSMEAFAWFVMLLGAGMLAVTLAWVLLGPEGRAELMGWLL